jgi:hypothetical protein
VVFFNAYSGTIAYVRMGRVDYRAGVLFTLAGLPGAILGTLLITGYRVASSIRSSEYCLSQLAGSSSPGHWGQEEKVRGNSMKTTLNAA